MYGQDMTMQTERGYDRGATLGMAGASMAIDGGSKLGGVMAQTAARQPEVRAEMERMEKATDLLGMTASTLLDRLDPVRTQANSAIGCGKESAPEPVLCGVAGAIRTQRQRVENVQQLLQRILNELEI